MDQQRIGVVRPPGELKPEVGFWHETDQLDASGGCQLLTPKRPDFDAGKITQHLFCRRPNCRGTRFRERPLATRRGGPEAAAPLKAAGRASYGLGCTPFTYAPSNRLPATSTR